MIPILYQRKETAYYYGGWGDVIGALDDALTCEITEELNGEYTLRMTYPRAGKWADQLIQGTVIEARGRDTVRRGAGILEEFFDVTEVSSTLPGILEVSANHISYRLDGYPIGEVTVAAGKTAAETWESLISACLIRTTVQEYGTEKKIMDYRELDIMGTLQEPVTFRNISLRQALLGPEKSMVALFGGQISYERLMISQTRERAGGNTQIRWGRNMESIREVRSTSSTYSGVFPFARVRSGGVETVVTLFGDKIYHRSGEAAQPVQRVLTKDFTDQFGDGESIDASALLEKVAIWAEKERYDLPKIAITVSFRDNMTERNSGLAVGAVLGEIARVYRRDGTTEDMRITKIVYDAIHERNKTITVGTERRALTNTILEMKRKLDRI